jgi:hypothetical protein
MLDAQRRVLGLGKANYSKDTVIPKDYLLKTNYQNYGKNTVDSFLVKLETNELKGVNEIKIYPDTKVITSKVSKSPTMFKTLADTLTLQIPINSNIIQISNQQFKNLPDGKLVIKNVVIDSTGNEGNPVFYYINKDTVSPEITLSKSGNSNYEIRFELKISEPIKNDLSLANLQIANANLINLTKSSSTVYTLAIRPICNSRLQIGIKSDAIQDLFDNVASTFITQSFETNGIGLPKDFIEQLELTTNSSKNLERKALNIISSEKLDDGAKYKYSAIGNLELRPGFISNLGTTFEATITKGCP